jgi:YVTN family beta-propeller protein
VAPNQNRSGFLSLNRGAFRKLPVLIVAIASVPGSTLWAQESVTPVNTVVATVFVGGEPFGVVVSPDNKFVYTANNGDGTVSVINAATNTVQTTISAGPSPAELAISSDGSKLYVSNEVSSGSVTVIDLANGNSAQTIKGAGRNPFGLALTPDGSQLWVADFGGNAVKLVDTSTNTVISSIAVGTHPKFITFTPDGQEAFVSCNHGVFVIGVPHRIVRKTIHFGSLPLGIAITPTGDTAYIVDFYDRTDSEAAAVIDTAKKNLTEKIQLGTGAPGNKAAILPNGQYLYYPEYEIGAVTLISTATNSVVAGGFGCGPPTDIAISPDGTHAYVTDVQDDIVTVVQISQ